MPLKTSAAGETIGMRYLSTKLGRMGPLARFIVKRRTPGPDWLSYEDIASELKTLTRESVTRAGVEKWAKAYGIPPSKPNATEAERAEFIAKTERLLRP
jgi:hypothetical protein